jgi:acetyl esterase
VLRLRVLPPQAQCRFAPLASSAYEVLTRWVAALTPPLRVSSPRHAGDSVGGNMTAAVTLLAKQRGGLRFAQQVLFS